MIPSPTSAETLSLVLSDERAGASERRRSTGIVVERYLTYDESAGGGVCSTKDADLMHDSDDRAGTARRQFLRTFFHDLATPLSAVSLHLEGASRRHARGQDPAESLQVAKTELAKAFELFEQGRDLLLSRPDRVESFAFDDWVELTVRPFAGDGVAIQGETGGRISGRPRATLRGADRARRQRARVLSPAPSSSFATGPTRVSAFESKTRDAFRATTPRSCSPREWWARERIGEWGSPARGCTPPTPEVS